VPCCLLETEESIAQNADDPDWFQCDQCEVSARLEALSPENREAWSIFRTCLTRLAGDGHAVGEVLRRLTAHIPDDDFPAVWHRLNLLYDVLCPEKPTS